MLSAGTLGVLKGVENTIILVDAAKNIIKGHLQAKVIDHVVSVLKLTFILVFKWMKFKILLQSLDEISRSVCC